MKNAYGNVVSFYDTSVRDGESNKDRGLRQFTNPAKRKPNVGNIVVFSGTAGNPYGHVAIVSKVSENEIEIVQQNTGPTAASRVRITLKRQNGKWQLSNKRVLGWLGKN